MARRVMETFPSSTAQMGIGITNTQRAQLTGFVSKNGSGHGDRPSPPDAVQLSEEAGRAQTNFDSWIGHSRFHIVEFDEQFGAGADPMRAKQLVRKKLRAFERIFARYDAIILVGGLGKGTGSGILPELAKLAKTMGKVCVVTAVFPYGFEGPGHDRRAKDARHELYMTTTTFLGYNENVYRIVTPEHARKLGMNGLNQIVNEKLLLPTVLLFLELLQRGGERVGDIENDLRDFWERICSHGTLGFISFYEVPKGRTEIEATEVVKALTENPLMGGAKIVKMGAAAMYHYHGQIWNSQLYRDISAGANKAIGPQLLEILPGILQNPNDGRQYVAAVVVAPYEPKVRAEAEAKAKAELRRRAKREQTDIDPVSEQTAVAAAIAEATGRSVKREDLGADVVEQATQDDLGAETHRDAVAEAEAALQEARRMYRPTGVLPETVEFPDWKPEYQLDLTSHRGTVKVPVRVDIRYRDLWRETERNKNSTRADFDRLIAILHEKGAWTRSGEPDNPRERSLALASA